MNNAKYVPETWGDEKSRLRALALTEDGIEPTTRFAHVRADKNREILVGWVHMSATIVLAGATIWFLTPHTSAAISLFLICFFGASGFVYAGYNRAILRQQREQERLKGVLHVNEYTYRVYVDMFECYNVCSAKMQETDNMFTTMAFAELWGKIVDNYSDENIIMDLHKQARTLAGTLGNS